MAPLLRWLSGGLQAQPVRDTSMVRVSFASPNPALAARVANAVAEAYIKTHLEQRLAASEVASDWLKAQLAKSQQSVEESIAKLQRYHEQAGLVNIEGMQSVYTEQLRALTSQLTSPFKVS